MPSTSPGSSSSLGNSWCCSDVLSWVREDDEEVGEEMMPCPVSHSAVWE